MSLTFTETVIAGETQYLTAYITDILTGDPITQSSLTSITAAVYNPAGDDPDTPLTTPSVVIVDTIYDTAQDWPGVSTGFNSQYELDGSNIPDKHKYYCAVLTYTPVTGAPFDVRWQLNTVDDKTG